MLLPRLHVLKNQIYAASSASWTQKSNISQQSFLAMHGFKHSSTIIFGDARFLYHHATASPADALYGITAHTWRHCENRCLETWALDLLCCFLGFMNSKSSGAPSHPYPPTAVGPTAPFIFTLLKQLATLPSPFNGSCAPSSSPHPRPPVAGILLKPHSTHAAQCRVSSGRECRVRYLAVLVSFDGPAPFLRRSAS